MADAWAESSTYRPGAKVEGFTFEMILNNIDTGAYLV